MVNMSLQQEKQNIDPISGEHARYISFKANMMGWRESPYTE